MAFETYDPSSDPMRPPSVFMWEKAKAKTRCACNDPWRMGCTNFDAPEITVKGNEACDCRCHRTEVR